MCRTCTTRNIVRAECLLQTKGCAHAMYLRAKVNARVLLHLCSIQAVNEEEKKKEKGR